MAQAVLARSQEAQDAASEVGAEERTPRRYEADLNDYVLIALLVIALAILMLRP